MVKKLLSPDMIDLLQKAVSEVATEVGFGMVAIVVERGEPRRVQKTVDFLLRARSEPPSCPPT